MPISGGRAVRIVDGLSYPTNFAVTADGIYYLAAIEGAQANVVLTIEKPWAPGLSISPDGRSLLITVVDREESKWALLTMYAAAQQAATPGINSHFSVAFISLCSAGPLVTAGGYFVSLDCARLCSSATCGDLGDTDSTGGTILSKNRPQAGETRAVLLAAAGGEPSDATIVWKYGAQDRGAACASGVESDHTGADI